MRAPDGMDKLRRQLEEISSPRFRQAALESLAEEARTQIVMGFRDSRSPYGEPWAPLESREGKPLLDTGRLRNSLMPRAVGTSLRIDANVAYAAAHQYGTKTIPRRQFLPDSSRGLGTRWTKAFRRVLTETMRDLGGR